MSDLLQSGHHPDADQLNAFVEHTLPPHEQEQTLAHLAICPDCRSIVSLSLPPVDEVPGLRPEPLRKPWFLSFVWPMAAALAGLVLFFIHFHSVAIHRGIGAGPTELAVAPSPPSLPNATTPKPATPATQPLVSSAQPANDRRPRPAVRAPEFADQAQTEAGVENQSVAKLPLLDRNLAGLKRAQPKSPIAPAPKPMQFPNGAAANTVANGGVVPQVSASGAKDSLQQNGSGSGLGNLRDQPAAAAPAASPVTALNQTVAVRAAPVATLSALSNNSIRGQEKSILPSGLAALSLVSAGHQVLAIDTHNALFFSDDNGIHWKAIPSQWQGHAVKVGMASVADVSEGRLSTNVNISYAPSGVIALGGPVLSPSPKSTLGGTVTDVTGAVIADASVVIGNATAPNIRTVKTGRDGTYLVDGLVPGSYRVEAQAPGFRPQQFAVSLAPAQQSQANVALSVGQATETVTVDAAAISIETPSPAKKKTAEPSLPGLQSPPRFEITTDTGEHWASSDGQTWKPR